MNQWAASKAMPTKVIKVEHPVDKNSYEKNVAALAAMAKKLQGQGSMPIVSKRLQAVMDASERKKGNPKKEPKAAKASNETPD